MTFFFILIIFAEYGIDVVRGNCLLVTYGSLRINFKRKERLSIGFLKNFAFLDLHRRTKSTRWQRTQRKLWRITWNVIVCRSILAVLIEDLFIVSICKYTCSWIFSPLFASIWSEYMTCTSQMSPSEYYDEYERLYLIWVFIMPCILSWFMKFKIVFFWFRILTLVWILWYFSHLPSKNDLKKV